MIYTKWNENWKFWNSKDAFALVWDVPEIARTITLPHDAMVEQQSYAESTNGGDTGFFDGGSYTYVKMYTSKKGDRQRNIQLKFEGVYMNTFVYVNGQLAGNRPYGYSEFYVPISHLLKEEGENEIRVQVRNTGQNCRWFSGSGIYRDVYLLESGPVYLKETGFHVETESIDEDAATLKVQATVVNKTFAPTDLYVHFQVLDADGKVQNTDVKLLAQRPNQEDTIFSRMTVEQPKLWSAETPNCYRVHVAVYEAKEAEDGNAIPGPMVDEWEEVCGIRTLQLDAKHGLRVNGQEVKLRGACMHQENGLLGAKTYDEAEYRRVRILKEAGFNAIRMAHQPASPTLLRACDELGMYIMDEAFDMWTRCKTDNDYNLFFQDWWRRDVEAMIEKDYNHPSVILYSIGNEIPEIGTDEGSRVAREISDLCHTLDPHRYTLASINGVFAAGDAVPKITADIVGQVKDTDDSVNVNDFMTIMEKYMDRIVVHPEITKRLNKACVATDIAGYNYMTARYALDAKTNPNRIMVGSETYPPEIATNWEEINKYPQVIGDFTWAGWDYIGEAGVGIPAYRFGEGGFGAAYPARLAYSGDIDITGFRRPASYYRQVVFGYRNAPFITVQDPRHYEEHLIKTPWVMSDSVSTWSWRGCEGKPAIVEVYAAGDEVELFVNNKSMGRKPAGKDVKFRTLFEVTYEPGELRAVSYCKGQVQGEMILQSAGDPTTISVEVEPIGAEAQRSQMEPVEARDRVVYLDINVVDENGVVCTDVEEAFHLEVLHGATLLGFGSGNPKSQEVYTDADAQTWNGRTVAILKLDGSNEAEISVTSKNVGSILRKI